MGFWADITGQTAASKAASATQAASEAAIAEQQRQFDVMQGALAPYQEAGEQALQQQLALSGALGAGAQQGAISGIQAMPGYQAALQQGEESILQNAAATGGVRGGQTQAVLAQYSPQLLQSAIDQQYSQLGGLTTLGANAAAGVGSGAMQTGTNVSNLLSGIGESQAQSALASYQLGKSFIGDVAGLGLGIAGLF